MEEEIQILIDVISDSIFEIGRLYYQYKKRRDKSLMEAIKRHINNIDAAKEKLKNSYNFDMERLGF